MKKSRHQKIIELVKKQHIETQEDLADLLNHEGYRVTQATVSRDIKELKLSKVAGNDGTQYYQIIEHKESKSEQDKYVRVLSEGLISMDDAGNLLVIRTMSGMANAVAAALDHFRFEKIVGTLAGDDTVMCAMKNVEDVGIVMQSIHEMIGR